MYCESVMLREQSGPKIRILDGEYLCEAA